MSLLGTTWAQGGWILDPPPPAISLHPALGLCSLLLPGLRTPSPPHLLGTLPQLTAMPSWWQWLSLCSVNDFQGYFSNKRKDA